LFWVLWHEDWIALLGILLGSGMGVLYYKATAQS